jgi:hypothetical protein
MRKKKYTLYTIACKGKHKTGVALKGFLREPVPVGLQTLSLNEMIKNAWFTESRDNARNLVKILKDSPWVKGPKWKCRFKVYEVDITYQFKEI